MKKLCFLVGIWLCLLSFFASPAFAAEAKSDVKNVDYGALFSGNYTLKYENVRTHKIYRVETQNGNRIVYSVTKTKKGEDAEAVSYGKGDSLYRFEDSGKTQVARVLPLADVDSELLDPQENWRDVRGELKLPLALRPLCWTDSWTQPYMPKSLQRPDNAKKTVEQGKDGYIEEYRSNILTQAGTVSGQILYRISYNASGQMTLAQALLEQTGKPQQVIETLKIDALVAAPADRSLDPTGIDIYAANRGDLADLLGKPAKVGKF